MITIDPLLRVMAERGLNIVMLSQLTNITPHDLSLMKKGRYLTKENIENLCRTLNVQPCDIIEFHRSETKGHWEWIEEEE